MKKLIILLLALMPVITSCSALFTTYQPQQRSTFVTFLDFRPYTSEGFFISPDPYNGEFEPIGQIFLTMLPEEKLISEEVRKQYDNVHYYGTDMYGFEKIPYAELLNQAVVRAISMGANGIADLKISKASYNSHFIYEVTGLCIKINQ